MRQLVLLLIAIPGAGLAQDCTAIPNSADRLACYDKASGAKISQVEMVGNWEVIETRVEGQDLVTASVTSQAEVQCGKSHGAAALTIDCTFDLPTMFVSYSCRPAPSGTQLLATHQLESHSFDLVLEPSKDGRSVGTWSNDIHGIRALSGNSSLTFTLAGTTTTVAPAVFDLEGFDLLYDRLLEIGCIWNPKAG